MDELREYEDPDVDFSSPEHEDMIHLPDQPARGRRRGDDGLGIPREESDLGATVRELQRKFERQARQIADIRGAVDTQTEQMAAICTEQGAMADRVTAQVVPGIAGQLQGMIQQALAQAIQGGTQPPPTAAPGVPGGTAA